MNTLRPSGEWGINLKSENKGKKDHVLNVKLTDSIRIKLIMLMLYIIGGTFLLYLLLNHLLLDDFYMKSKQDAFMEAYEDMNEIVNSESGTYGISETAQYKLSGICESYGIAVVILGTNNSLVFQYGNGAELSLRLAIIDFGINDDNVSIIKRTNKYIFQSLNTGGEGYLEIY